MLADFDDATFENDGIVSRMFRDGERFMIHTEGEDGEMRDFHVKYVFGVEPLQQYMVEFDRTDETKEDEIPRVQVLRISWDTAKKNGFICDRQMLPTSSSLMIHSIGQGSDNAGRPCARIAIQPI